MAVVVVLLTGSCSSADGDESLLASSTQPTFTEDDGSISSFQTDPLVGSCSDFDPKKAGGVISLLSDGQDGESLIVEAEGGRVFGSALYECRFSAGVGELIVAFYGGPCDFYDVATDPTEQVSTSPLVFLAGDQYACGDVLGGSVVALYGGPGGYPNRALLEKAWVAFFASAP